MKWSLFAAALAVSITLSACGEEAEPAALACGAGEAACGSSCARLDDDPRHCGACGNACAQGQACSGGICTAACPDGATACDGACLDLATSAAHCGACGNACGAGESCVDGACTSVCPAGQTLCDGACHTLPISPDHCGACGNACGAGEACADGVCTSTCPVGQTACDGGCHDLDLSRRHCGACGVACGAGELCVDGACTEDEACPAGLTECDGSCRNLDADRWNCGGCGTVCAADELCGDGACVRTCAAGFLDCDGACRDAATDAAHCGACGNACAAGEACLDGACAPSCGTFADTVCDGVCTNTDLDARNCGACGTVCGRGLVCSDGACTATCGATLDICDGACTDTLLDPANCGACGNVCPAGPGIAPACFGGECLTFCAAGRADCDGDFEESGGNGCETHVAADPANCGGCGIACPVVANGAAGCMAGVCGIGACDAGWADCNGDEVDGCETDIDGDEANCGGCGIACVGADVCYQGACVPPGPGESCSDPFVLDTAAPNGITRSPASLDHFTAAPSCAGGAPAGGDLVFRFDAAASGPAEIVVEGAPGGPRRHLVVSAQACGAATQEIACASSGSGDTVRAAFSATAGATYWAYLADVDPGSLAADVPLTVHARTYDCAAFAPAVAGLEPAPGDLLEQTIAVTFGSAIDPAGGTVTITGDKGTSLSLAADGASVAWSGDGRTLTLLPAEPFAPGELLTVSWTGLEDANCGKAVAAPAWSFVASAPPCTPGEGGMVGTTLEPIATGAFGSFSEAYVVADTAPDGWVYVGGTSNLYRFRKDGTAVEAVHVDASLGPALLGYHLLIDGRNIYLAESKTSGQTGHVFRISVDGGATWRVEDAVRFPAVPADDIHSLASHGGRVYMLTHEAAIANPTQIWSIHGDAAALPADAVLDLEFGAGAYRSCAGLVVDAEAFYVNCLEGSSNVLASALRIDRTTGAISVLASGLHGNTTNMALQGRDADGDGSIDHLYRSSSRRETHYVCDPAAPYVGSHHTYGSGNFTNQQYGLGYDPVANVLWAWDDTTNELVKIH